MEHQSCMSDKSTHFIERVIKIKSNKCVICHKEKENTYDRFCTKCSEDEIKLRKYNDNLEKKKIH